MRQIGKIEHHAHADRFSSFLLTQGIEAAAEEDDGRWAIWVRDEDQLDRARDELLVFQQNPEDPKYRTALNKAEQLRREHEKVRRNSARNQVDVRTRVWGPPQAKQIPITIAAIVASIVVAIFSGFGQQSREAPIRQLAFADPIQPSSQQAPSRDGFRNIRQGQIWRLVTPIFIHYGTVHILFNMLLFYPLASRIESRRNSIFLAALILVIAVVSNCAEYMIGGVTSFGGMSGVVYGLFGFVWMRMMFHPQDGLAVDQQLIIILLVWLGLGFSGILRQVFGMEIANWVHLFGLLSGLALGYALPSRGASR